jgi:hypothetical protein
MEIVKDEAPKFNTITEGQIDVVKRQRTLTRQNISQFTQITGSSKTIIMSDGENNRVRIGFKGA